MADNRQFADHGVIGGVDVFYEDKKLAESPSQSSVASTDYFVLKDTDGVPHKIVKSDVLEMVRDAMGTILANNNKGTSVAKVPTIGSSGNDLGSSSVADLASVLGVPFYRKVITDANVSVSDTKDFFFSTSSGSPIANTPTSANYWRLITISTGGTSLQLFYDAENIILYYRLYWSGWGTWRLFSYQ